METLDLFQGVSVDLSDIFEIGGCPLESRGFVGLSVAERHQHVQLITAQPNSPPENQYKCLSPETWCHS